MATVLVSEDKLCDMCQRDSKSAQATTWCYDCTEALCGQCSGFHRLSKMSSKHRTASIEDIADEEIAASRLDINVNCDLHPRRALEFFCVQHNEFSCAFCTTTQHKECRTVVPIEDIAEMSGDKRTNRSLEFSKIPSYVKNIIQLKETEISDLDKEKKSILAEAFLMVTVTKDKLDQLFIAFENIVQKKYTNIKQSYEQTLGKLQMLLTNIDKFTNSVQLLRHVSDNENIIMMEKMRRKTQKQFQEMAEILKKGANVKFTFKPDSTMTTVMNTLSLVGEVEEMVKSSKSTEDVVNIEGIINSLDVSLLISTTAQYPVLGTKHDLLKANVHFLRAVTCTDLNLVQKPWLYDGTFIDDKTCLFTDHDNSRLLLFVADLKFKREIKVEKFPTGITLNQDKTGVFVGHYHDGVLLYSLQEDYKVTRKISVESNVRGVGTSDDSIITGHDGSVIQYDALGNKIKTVSTRDHAKSIAVSNDGTRFYHRDGDEICCRDVKACTEIWMYNNKDLSDPRGICVDNNDNVYTTGLNSKNVHQISQDGSQHRVLIDKLNRIDIPWAIVFHPTRPMFIVTSFQEDVVMEVYELS